MADKTISTCLYVAHKDWISLEKGRIFVPKVRSMDVHLTDEETEDEVANLVRNAVAVGTLQADALKQAGVPSTRRKLKKVAPRNKVLITWVDDRLKVILNSFSEYTNITFLPLHSQ